MGVEETGSIINYEDRELYPHSSLFIALSSYRLYHQINARFGRRGMVVVIIIMLTFFRLAFGKIITTTTTTVIAIAVVVVMMVGILLWTVQRRASVLD